MINVIIIAVIAVPVLLGIKKFIGITKGENCCSSAPIAVKRTGPADKNKANYTCSATVSIQGMACKNCAARVENALNELDGIWAKVSLARSCAKVLSKKNIDEALIRDTITNAGYSCGEVTQEI